MFKKKTALEKEWARLQKEELRFLSARQNREEGWLSRLLAEKIPSGLRGTLEEGFSAAFTTIFSRGNRLINWTIARKKHADNYRINTYAAEVRGNRASLRRFTSAAKRACIDNLFFSGTVGIVMGIVGVGIPDIPVFTTLLLRSLYEIAAVYGFSSDTEEERAFILYLIESAVSFGDEMLELNGAIDALAASMQLPADYERHMHQHLAAGALSGELLYMKFLQGIPVVGAVGGAYDVVYMKRITAYAELKYRRRFLLTRMQTAGENT